MLDEEKISSAAIKKRRETSLTSKPAVSPV